MESVYTQSFQGASAALAADRVGGANRKVLEGVARLSQAWADRLSVDDPLRGSAIRLRTLADDLIRGGRHSSEAMTTTRTLLCVTCRRLNASQGKCSGQALHRCLLLNGANP